MGDWADDEDRWRSENDPDYKELHVAKTRSEHMAWAKARALEYVDAGQLDDAFASFASDLGKHEELAGAVNLVVNLGMPLLMGGHLSTPQQMRKFIEDFN